MVFGPRWACFSADCHEILYAHRGTSIYLGLKVDLANRQVFAADIYIYFTLKRSVSISFNAFFIT